MKKLTMFLRFDFVKFAQGKRYVITGLKFNETRGCVSLDVAIIEDTMDYGDPTVTNLYERFKVHCVKDVSEDDLTKYSIQREIRFKTVGKCAVYGEYNSNLSVEAEVEVVK